MKLFSSFILCLCSVLGFSQTILYQAESTSRTVQDPQSVILAQGFYASSNSSNPFIAKIGPATENPEGGPADSNAGATNPSGTTAPAGKSFHDTKGNIEVNGAGQLQFTLPIALPPGIKSVAPQINLMYTSGSSNGVAGYSWNLSGVTTISRVGRNIEKDGEIKGIQLDYSDYYSFNGQRLILKSGEYGKDGAEYVTEKYSNIKIKSVGTITGQLWQGPEYWEVTFEDGSQSWYGATASGNSTARTPLEYNIVKWKDLQGNYITYNYTQNNSNHVAIISSITWGGNETLSKPHFNHIEFKYSDRNLKESNYVYGLELVQDKLLTEIIVKYDINQFKKYVVEYGNNGTNYQFVKTITEYNTANEAANPIVFENEADPLASNLFNNNSRFDEIYGEGVVSGDFNGDGKLDFVKGATLMLSRLDGNSTFFTVLYTGSPISRGTFLKNGNLIPKDALYTLSSSEPDGKTRLRIYDFNGNNFEEITTKELDFSSYNFNSTAGYTPIYSPSNPLVADNSPYKFLEGDFNGDGISEFIISTLKVVQEEIWGYDWNGYPELQGAEEIGYEVFDFYFDPLTNTLKRVNLPLSDYSKYIGQSLFTSPYYYKPVPIGDFDGDGKTDLISLISGTKVYSLNTVTKEFDLKVQSPAQISVRGVALLGDFNGDGKTDVMSPIAEDSSDWKMFISTGKGIIEHYYSNLALYQPQHTGAPTKRRNTIRNYFAPDLNKDGKSDFLTFQSEVWFRELAINNPDSSYGFNYFRNDGVDSAGKPILNNVYNISPKEATSWGDNDDEDINYSKYGEHYLPLLGTFRLSQLNTDFAIIHKTKLITWNLGSKIDKISRIKSITQGGIKTDLEYSPLVNEGNIYKSYLETNTVTYPYVNIKENLNYHVVSKLTQGERKQEFRYRDLIGHLHGRGIIGFRQTARSTFFANGFENTKIWTGSEINPTNEGLPYKDWSIRTTDENKIFPTDISLNNTQLLSFKQYDHKIDKLLNGNVVTSVSDADKPKIVLAINPFVTTSKDFLTNTKTVHTVEQYDNLYLPKKSVTRINDGYSVSTTELEYYPPNITPGINYSIGKPKVKTETIQAYGDTKSAKEEYTYENNLLKTLKTWNRDNTGYLLETYTYDGFGNITQKTISNSIDSQTQTTGSLYDPKGRFVIKKTDNLGLETHIEYNDWGQIKKQTDPSGNTLVNTYDPWGKLLTFKTNLGGTTTYQYERDNNSNIIVTQYDPDGDISKKYTNKLGQEYKVSTKAFGQGQFVSQETQYDVLGRKIKESEPYFEGQSANQWNVIVYDDSVYPAKGTATSFNGRQVETSVSGLTTTVKELNGYGRTTSKTTDALGNIISTTDKGGTVTFAYNAAGEQIKAQYAENIVTTKYDSWGRKSEFNDPSNGLYKYEYDGFGQPKKIISPKGTKEYTYNNLGQLISQKELSTTDGGEATNKMITFTYDDKGRVISKGGTSKGKAYSSNVLYDPQGRLLSSSESSNGKYYIRKGITYDDKGRVISYEKQLYSSGVLTKVQIENVYSAWNGELYQVKDKASGKILWELKETNAKGQVLKAKLGAAEVNNTYDNNGFLTNVNHSSAVKPGILQLSYSFDAIKNELKSRTTGGDFNIVESFDYDDNNRLVNWTNPVTGIKPTTNRNVYDVKGRIMENDQVGTMKYENSAKIYQPTGMTLNAAGTQNYNNDLIQSIAYNENNDPVFIDGMKGDVAFQYGLTSMRQRVTYGGNFSTDGEGKFTKYYSEDGSYEIVKDNTTGKEKHILYIGGTPYESNIVYLKNFTESSGSYKFLHKDYIGSILAISDEAGNKLEQRHFDAWGNFTHLQIGNGAIITDKNIIDNASLLMDRGYTSHEHFAEVGIIHMNGRLYDPLLRRFLNADENIQDPYNTQNYNKYGYVMNNPLMFNDPSGEFIVESAFLSAVIIGAMVASFSYTIMTSISGQNWDLGQFFKSTLFGAASAAVTYGIGSVFVSSAGTATQIATELGKFGTIMVQGAAHAVAQGVLSLMQGQDFVSAFTSGLFGSYGASAFSAVAGKFASSAVGVIASGAVLGGVGSELTGGNFWQGAAIGGVVAGLNHAMHQMGNGFDNDEESFAKRSLTPKERQKIGENYPDYKNYPDAHSVYKEVGGPLYQEYLKNPDKYINTCAIRLSVAFEKSGIDIGGEWTGVKGTKYYTSATKMAQALDSRFISHGQGYNISGWGINVQYKNKSYTGSVYHVDVAFIKNGKGVFGHTLYSPYYNKFY
ncbi:T6SS effector amidase Tae4 family protein [Chryseobacterium gossypii]|uniref:T6SS effector amidase Tae4 family protein n=1 Tax=Chryseobacterium gossypii TaxID=3231602 RepID=UPI003524F3D3